jgi:threonine/homoserine/homoserine lactone efflux protein
MKRCCNLTYGLVFQAKRLSAVAAARDLHPVMVVRSCRLGFRLALLSKDLGSVRKRFDNVRHSARDGAHVLAATLGFSALLVSSATAYSFVRFAGAAYLFYLGIKKFRERGTKHDGVKHVQALPLRRVYAQGLLVNVLNPKTAIFFFAFLPQFVNPARGRVSLQFLALGILFTAMGFFSDSMWALTAGSAAGWLQHNRSFMRNQHYVSGTVYMGLGLATAMSGSRHK